MVPNTRFLELGAAFWIGVGLMSIITVIKLSNGTSPILYSWIMFGVAVVLGGTSLILRSRTKK